MREQGGQDVVCMVLTGERRDVLMMEINACPRKQDLQQNRENRNVYYRQFKFT